MIAKRIFKPARLLFLALLAALTTTGCSLSSNAESDTADAQSIGGLPVVYLAAPPTGASYLEGVEVVIQAQISNAGADIAQVEFWVDNALVATRQSPNTTGAAVFGLAQIWTAAGVGAHTLAVTASRGDGTTGSAEVFFYVVEPSGSPFEDMGILQPEPPESAQPPPADDAPPPEQDTQTGSTGVVTALFERGMNVRSGPGLDFTPPIGSFMAGQTAEILGTNSDETWLKVRFNDGEGWVYYPYVTVQGDLRALPHEAGPTTP